MTDMDGSAVVEAQTHVACLFELSVESSHHLVCGVGCHVHKGGWRHVASWVLRVHLGNYGHWLCVCALAITIHCFTRVGLAVFLLLVILTV